MNRIMIAGTHSGCGKTTIVCAILQALVNRKLKTAAFKCGPDYIDPMFHSEIIGTKARNLDGFFMEPSLLRYLLQKNAEGCDVSVIEGVMGYYDGIGMQETASSYRIAADTKTPVILVINCKGMSRSVEAVLEGFLHLEPASGIRGVIFNQLPPSLYEPLKEFCGKRGIHAFGCFPLVKEAQIESRHLGLVTAQEIEDLKQKVQRLAETAEEYLDLDGILKLSKEAEESEEKPDDSSAWKSKNLIMQSAMKYAGSLKDRLKIAVARDRAFCFYYEDNLELLRECGCELIPFSPLRDKSLPEGIDGLLLGGGYPELYGRDLSGNKTMLADIRQKIEEGLPTHAECGGFMYLHREMTDPEGNTWPLVGALDGTCRFQNRLQHFGYVNLCAKEENPLCEKDTQIPAHEFHRSVSDLVQTVFDTEKNGKHWGSFIQQQNLIAGFPHIHYYANPKIVSHFLETMYEYRTL
ncbi:MAG: cobyrinate a,c-diamide synthase [Lachnospiraceae bacterium]|nr:cobyrinate a,c-diamide synthase [Lachnospiraceae bacterium]